MALPTPDQLRVTRAACDGVHRACIAPLGAEAAIGHVCVRVSGRRTRFGYKRYGACADCCITPGEPISLSLSLCVSLSVLACAHIIIVTVDKVTYRFVFPAPVSHFLTPLCKMTLSFTSSLTLTSVSQQPQYFYTDPFVSEFSLGKLI